MKKIILGAFVAIALTLAAPKTEAQVIASAYSMTGSGDTITNTATKYLTYTVKDSYASVEFQIVTTKISGTVAGTSVLQASLDGTNYINIGADTLTNANQTTNTHFWNVSPNKYLYYRIKTTGSGTMAASHRGYLVPRK